jgi:hypothetical protein
MRRDLIAARQELSRLFTHTQCTDLPNRRYVVGVGVKGINVITVVSHEYYIVAAPVDYKVMYIKRGGADRVHRLQEGALTELWRVNILLSKRRFVTIPSGTVDVVVIGKNIKRINLR